MPFASVPLPHWCLLGLLLAGIGLSLHDARNPFLWGLEAAPVLLGLVALIATYRWIAFTTFTYALIAFSFGLILIGAHYTYAQVPWFNALRDAYGWERNHFDRLGHVFQGVVPAMVLRELLLRKAVLRRGGWLNVLIVLSCTGISALYEIAEMIAAFCVEGATIEWFLGFQGDEWDTQKDMLMALGGAIAALMLLSGWQDRALAKVTS